MNASSSQGKLLTALNQWLRPRHLDVAGCEWILVWSIGDDARANVDFIARQSIGRLCSSYGFQNLAYVPAIYAYIPVKMFFVATMLMRNFAPLRRKISRLHCPHKFYHVFDSFLLIHFKGQAFLREAQRL